MRFIKKLGACFFAVLFAISFSMSASAFDMTDYAYPLENDFQYTALFELSSDYNSYKYGTGYFSIECGADGELSFDISTNASSPTVTLYDAGGKSIHASDISNITGNGRIKNYTYLNGNEVDLERSEAFERYEGTIKYQVTKGTYYLGVYGYEKSEEYRLFSITAHAPEKKVTPKIDYFNIDLKRGDTLQFGAELSKTGTVTWKSSKKSVATVSSNGKVTAKAKGSAIITAKCGNSTVKIKVTVK